MAKSRTRRTTNEPELDLADAAPAPPPAITTGGNPSKPPQQGGALDLDIGPDDVIGGLVPAWEKNLVIEIYPGAVVERVDDQNWQAKVLRRVESGRGGIAAKTSIKWEGVGYYASPGSAARKLLHTIAASEPGRIELAALVDRLEIIFELVSSRIIAGERAKALDDVSHKLRDPDDIALVRGLARRYADGTDVQLSEATKKVAKELAR